MAHLNAVVESKRAVHKQMPRNFTELGPTIPWQLSKRLIKSYREQLFQVTAAVGGSVDYWIMGCTWCFLQDCTESYEDFLFHMTVHNLNAKENQSILEKKRRWYFSPDMQTSVVSYMYQQSELPMKSLWWIPLDWTSAAVDRGQSATATPCAGKKKGNSHRKHRQGDSSPVKHTWDLQLNVQMWKCIIRKYITQAVTYFLCPLQCSVMPVLNCMY